MDCGLRGGIVRCIIVMMILVFAISGCSRIKTYTYERDRVDQAMQQGNRGYMLGTPPPAESREGFKRKMIGTDIEVPLMPWEKKTTIPPEAKNIPPKEKIEGLIEIPPAAPAQAPVVSAPSQIKGESDEDDKDVK